MDRLLLECAVRAVLIAAATAFLLRVMRVKTAAARHAFWTSVMVLMLLLPAWTAWGPKAAVHALPTVLAPIAGPSTPMASRTVGLIPPPEVWSAEKYFAVCYLLGAAYLLIRLAAGMIRARRLSSAACVTPITVGVLRSRIILPESSRQWPREQLDAVLTHEGEHVRRRDPLIQWLALFNRAIFWFHPLAWWLEQRLSALAEEACDAAVLERGHNPREYSAYLLDLARSVERAGTRVRVLGMAMPGSFLAQRVKTILDGARAPGISRTRLACATAAIAISSTVFAAGSLERAIPALPPITGGVLPLATMVPPAIVPVTEAAPAIPVPSSVPSSVLRTPKVLLAQNQTTPAPAVPPVPDGASPESLIPIQFEYDQSVLNRAETSVHITVTIPGSVLERDRREGLDETSIDYFCVVTDEFGTAAATVRDKMNIKLGDATPAELGQKPVRYEARFRLLPGTYTVRFLARDNPSGRLGTFESPLVVPNPNKPK